MEYLAAKLEKDSKRRQNNGEDNINTSSCSHFTLQFLFFFKQDYGIADWVGRHWYEGCYIYMYMFFIYIYIYISTYITCKKNYFSFFFFRGRPRNDVILDTHVMGGWTCSRGRISRYPHGRWPDYNILRKRFYYLRIILKILDFFVNSY